MGLRDFFVRTSLGENGYFFSDFDVFGHFLYVSGGAVPFGLVPFGLVPFGLVPSGLGPFGLLYHLI